MTSYSKQLASLAAQWSAANPGPLPLLPSSGAGLTPIWLPARCCTADEFNRWRMANPGPDSGKLTAMGPWCVLWDRSGRNVFDLSADFVAAMLLTDPSAVSIDCLRTPFPAMLITIPSGFAVGAEGLHYTKIHVSERHRSSGVPVIIVQAFDGVHSLDHSFEASELTWPLIEQSLDAGGETQIGYAKVADDADDEAQRTALRIVFGLLAYMGAVDGAASRREADSGKRKRPSGAPDPQAPVHWDVGRSVRLDPQLVRAARSGSREIALRIRRRFIVRGHYRNQACGAGRTDRRRQWIAPHWKGPEAGAQIVHTYKPQPIDSP